MKKIISFILIFGILIIFSGVYAFAENPDFYEDSDYFIVTDYGASVDEYGDDGEYIQNAFDACNEAGGGTVYFPCGVYCSSKTVFYYSNQNIVFEDGAVMKRITNEADKNDTCGVFLCNWFNTEDTNSQTSAIACKNVTISGGTFDGGGATPSDTPVPVAMINTCHADGITITDCRFINNFNAHCIEINSSDNVTITNCEFNDYYGISSQIKYNEIIQIDKCVNGALGSFFDGDSYRTLCGYKAVTYIDYTSPDFKGCNNISINNCNFIANEYCSAIGNHHESISETMNTEIHIFGNTFSGGTGTRGYIVFDCYTTDIEIYENKFYGGECGVTVNAETAECYVYNNEFYDCKTVSKGDVTAYDNYVENEAAQQTGFNSLINAIKDFFNMFLNLFKMLFGI